MNDIKAANRIHRRETDLQTLKAIITNPVVELVGAYVVLEVLKRQKIIGTGVLDIKESVLMTAVAGAVALQQLQPTLPTLYQSSAEGSKAVLDIVGKAAPALLMAGA